MLNFIFGQVVDIDGNTVVVKCNDVGYELIVSSNTLADLSIDKTVQLYCYLQVKEDGLTLFGFSTLAEKKMFLRLISVSGIGGKMAQTILSGMRYNDLAMAIYSGDTRLLTKIKGLGKKTAERLVLELKEKVQPDGDQPVQQSSGTKSKEYRDSVDILVSLGLSVADAEKRVEASQSLGAQTVEEILNYAFKIS